MNLKLKVLFVTAFLISLFSFGGFFSNHVFSITERDLEDFQSALEYGRLTKFQYNVLTMDISTLREYLSKLGKESKLKDLLFHNVDLNGEGNVLCHLAYESGRDSSRYTEIVRMLLQTLNRNERKKYLLSTHPVGNVLSDAVSSGSADMIRLVLDEGKKVGLTLQDMAPDNDKAILHSAVARGDVNIVKLLLEYGANVTVQDCLGRTALDTANEIYSCVLKDKVLGYKKIASRYKKIIGTLKSKMQWFYGDILWR